MASDPQRRWLHHERVKLLTSMDPFAHVATILNAGLLTLILWRVISHAALLTWLTGILAICGFRFVLMRRDSPHWDAWFITGAALSGAAWGTAAIVLFPSHSLVHQVFLAFATGGIVAKAIPIFSPLLASYVAFTLPALLPITVRFLIWGDELHLVMGGVGVLYTIGMLVTAKRAHDIYL